MTGRKSNLEKDVEQSFHEIEEQVRKLSQMGKAMSSTRLTNKAVLLLVRGAVPSVRMTDIKKVLDILPKLEKIYLKPERIK